MPPTHKTVSLQFDNFPQWPVPGSILKPGEINIWVNCGFLYSYLHIDLVVFYGEEVYGSTTPLVEKDDINTELHCEELATYRSRGLALP